MKSNIWSCIHDLSIEWLEMTPSALFALNRNYSDMTEKFSEIMQCVFMDR